MAFIGDGQIRGFVMRVPITDLKHERRSSMLSLPVALSCSHNPVDLHFLHLAERGTMRYPPG